MMSEREASQLFLTFHDRLHLLGINVRKVEATVAAQADAYFEALGRALESGYDTVEGALDDLTPTRWGRIMLAVLILALVAAALL